MGTWSTGISSSDLFKDIHSDFYDLFNKNLPVDDIKRKLQDNYRDSIDDPDESNEFWFAIGLSLWECGKLDEDTYHKIEDIIISNNDLIRWKRLGAADSDINKRAVELNNYLEKLKTVNLKPRKPKIIKLRNSIFGKGDCLSISLENNKYGAAIVLTQEINTQYGSNLVLVTDYYKDTVPIINEIKKSGCIIFPGPWGEEPLLVYCQAGQYKKKKYNIDKIGNIPIKKEYPEKDGPYSYGHWDHISITIYYHNKSNTIAGKKVKVMSMI